MSCPFISCERIFPISIKPTLRPDPTINTLISMYDSTFIWSSEHVSPTQLNQWRQQGDRSIDHFFKIYGDQLQDGEDTYKFIQKLSLCKEHVCDEQCRVFCIFNFDRNIRQPPYWFDREQIQRGQHFFLKHSSVALTSIFYYTLLLGYGFQQLNDVFVQTHYLSSFDLAVTYRRLVETLQMIMNIVCGDIEDFDHTFLDIIRVRLLHGMVRYKITKHSRSSTDQVPINQEDALITLLGFSFSVLYCMEERIGIRISDVDKQSYLHLWRYIGWLIGIEEEFLYYLSSYKLARIISESIFYHYYLPSQISKHMIHHSLMAIYTHGLLSVSLNFHIGISQRLFGKEVSQALGIDEPIIDRLHFCAIELLFKIFQFSSWLTKLNCQSLNKWIIQRNKKRLKHAVYSTLNNQLCNFALFKSYKPSISNEKRKKFEDCPCGYNEKKHGRTIKTYDIALFRLRKPIFYAPILLRAFALFCTVFILRYLVLIITD